jgi:plasmid stabilization system protein ParE
LKWPRLEIDATNDAVRAAERFSRISVELGEKFVETFARSLEQIQRTPRRFPLLETNETREEIRRVILHRFNYLIIFKMVGDTPVVVAVMHASQQPDSWRQGQE